MTHDTYPSSLQRHNLPSSMRNQGFRLYSWLIPGDAYDSPMEPLTQEYWNERGAVLRYGLTISGGKEIYGDLVILLVQKMSNTTDRRFGGISELQRSIVFKSILKLSYPHTICLLYMPTNERQKILEACEILFAHRTLPFRDETGSYRRNERRYADVETLSVDENGIVTCPHCSRKLAVVTDVKIIKRFFVVGGGHTYAGLCKGCGKPLSLRSKY